MKKLIAISLLATSITLPALMSGAPKQTDKEPLSPAALSQYALQYSELLSILQNQYVDSLDMKSIIKTGFESMLNQVDPYTEYYDLDNIEELTMISSGNYGGVGSSIAVRDSIVIMAEPYYGKPAYNAGVRHGDIILEIDDYIIPKKDLKASDISKRLKGNPGSHVRVKVKRPWITDGSDSIFVFDIERQKINIDPVPYSTVFDEGIAYIEVTTFNRSTADEIRKAFSEIKTREGKNLKGVILDLRDNGGGVMEGALNLLSIFIDRGTYAFETRYRGGEIKKYKTRKSPVDTKIPIVVLVNDNTASASEIVAGAIQDLDRGVIMGTRTYGKGLVQTSGSLGFGSQIKYTTGKYYLPSGRLIQALDYRDSDGQPTLIPDSLTHEYRTANGRLVRDGRGISPDVKIEPKIATQLCWQLVRNYWTSDFADRYRNTHPAAPALDSLVTDGVFEEFKTFVNPAKLQYGKLSKSGISYLRSAAEVEGLKNDSVTAAIDALEKLMQHDLTHELDANREEIVRVLESEIADRYYTPQQINEWSISKDETIKKARELLKDTERYRDLLLPKDKAPDNKSAAQKKNK